MPKSLKSSKSSKSSKSPESSKSPKSSDSIRTKHIKKMALPFLIPSNLKLNDDVTREILKQ